MPCGIRFCPVPMRLLWPISDFRVRNIAAIYGVGMSEIDRRAEDLRIHDQRPHRRRMAYSKTEFKRLWADQKITLEYIGAQIGMFPRCVTLHARKLGLPERKCGPKPNYTFDAEFEAMWAAKVSCQDMADHYGCSKSLISVEAKRRKLPPRPRAGQLMPMSEFLAARASERLAEAMRRDAEIARLTRKLRSSEQGQPVPAALLKRATEILADRRAA